MRTLIRENRFSPSAFLALACLGVSLFSSATCTAAVPNIPVADRSTVWSPGVSGGIPRRTTIYTTINASTFGNGTSDATAGIQTAIDNCPAGQVVQLSAGIFTINNDIVYLNKGITLRGAGPTQTTLQRTNGAVVGSSSPRAAKPVIIVGPSRWTSPVTAFNLAANAVKGANSVQLATAPSGGFVSGQIVKIDELSGAAWRADPEGRGQIWASADYRVSYQRHNPAQPGDDPWPDSAGWFCRQDRPTCEIKEVQSYDSATRTVTFKSPFHIDYRTANTAQLSVYATWDRHVSFAGVEDLKVQGGDDGQLRFHCATNCWASRIDNTGWLGEGFAIDDCSRVEVRDSYVHTPVEINPGGGSYNLSLAQGSSEILIENNISRDANKVMVSRCSGAGSVVGYNYMDDGRIEYAPTWVEIGLNASHMVGPHHVLFEGNYCFNADSDNTHGNSILHTFFRNHLSGQRRNCTDEAPLRTVGLMPWTYWMSFIGNVLGRSGQMTGWVYESQNFGDSAIWMLGWDSGNGNLVDPYITALTYRHANFDYVTNSVHWDANTAGRTLANSLYLSQRPAFFDAGTGYTWPWVDPIGSTKLYTLPAKARYDAGTPFVQPNLGAPPPPPAAPSNLAATAASYSQINLAWTDLSSNETGFRIERSPSATGPWSEIAVTGSNATTYQNSGLSGGTTYYFRVRATNSGGDSAYSNTAQATTPPATGFIKIGEPNVLSQDDNGNGNLMVAQQAVLTQTATLQSLSFYVTNAAGKLRLGVYDAGGPSGGPGAKKAETNEITPVAGWNTANVITPLALQPGTYWLAYLASDNNLAFKKDPSGVGKYYGYTYGVMPAVFSTTPTTETVHWSLYATLTLSTNHPPVASNVSASTAEDVAKLITLTATDADGDTLTYSIVSNPAHGTLSGTGSSRTYTPALNYNGSDSFTFKAQDATSTSNTATVSITVTAVNDAPTVATPAAATPNPLNGTTAALSALGADDGGEANLTYTWSVVTAPAAVSFNPNGTNAAKNTQATFTLAGAYTLRVTIQDAGGLSVTSSVNLTVNPPANQAPLVNAGSDQTLTLPGQASLHGTVSDDGLPNPPGAVTSTWSKFSGPGTVAFADVHAPITTATFDTAGTYVLRLTASDGALSTSDDLTVQVNLPVNHPPVLGSGPTATPNPARVGQSVTFQASASDPDGDPLDYLWDFGDGEVDFGESVTHAYAGAGVYQVKLTVDDGIDEISGSLQLVVDHGLSTTRLIVRLNFALANNDKFTLKTGVVSLPLSFQPSGATVALDLGGAPVSFVLDSRGRGKNSLGTCALQLSQGRWIFRATQKGGAWADDWLDEGLINGDITSLPVTLAATLTLGGQSYSGERDLLYKARLGRYGAGH